MSENIVFPCDQDGVLKLLPHRDPFVWVTRVVQCQPGESIIAELDVREDLDLFKGHFPGQPILPGVIIMEALAQASCCCMMVDPDMQGKIGYLVGIDKAKFRKQVLPGDTLRLESKIIKSGKLMCAAEVVAKKEDENGNLVVCAQAVQKYILGGE